MGEARVKALKKMTSAVKGQKVSAPRIQSCQRKTRTRVSCKGLARGEDFGHWYRCDLKAVVRNQEASLVRKDCRRLNKPYLTEAAAYEELRKTATELDGPSTPLGPLVRESRTAVTSYFETYIPESSWDFKTCRTPLKASLRGGQIKVTTGTKECVDGIWI